MSKSFPLSRTELRRGGGGSSPEGMKESEYCMTATTELDFIEGQLARQQYGTTSYWKLVARRELIKRTIAEYASFESRFHIKAREKLDSSMYEILRGIAAVESKSMAESITVPHE